MGPQETARGEEVVAVEDKREQEAERTGITETEGDGEMR